MSIDPNALEQEAENHDTITNDIEEELKKLMQAGLIPEAELQEKEASEIEKLLEQAKKGMEEKYKKEVKKIDPNDRWAFHERILFSLAGAYLENKMKGIQAPIETYYGVIGASLNTKKGFIINDPTAKIVLGDHFEISNGNGRTIEEVKKEMLELMPLGKKFIDGIDKLLKDGQYKDDVQAIKGYLETPFAKGIIKHYLSAYPSTIRPAEIKELKGAQGHILMTLAGKLKGTGVRLGKGIIGKDHLNEKIKELFQKSLGGFYDKE